MSRYGPDTLVTVFPFIRQPEGDEIIIGRRETAVFVALPPDGVELLDQLASGKTVGEAQVIYQALYGELPDLEDFLTLLEEKGFVFPTITGGSGATAAVTANPAVPTVRYHLQRFPEALARRLFGPKALIAYGAVIALGLALVLTNPAILPSRTAMYFPHNMTAMRLSLMALGIVMVAIHELAHLVAARAAGVPSRLGLGNRLWVLVAETDMTGIWALPRGQRYLPMLAGPLVDGVTTALLLMLSFANQIGWVALPMPVYQITQALLLSYLLQLLWQCYFFVQTDFYYVFANYFRCKNLMADTERYLRNLLGRFVRWVDQRDLSYIPAAEMRIIRVYAVFWVLGRLAAAYALIAIFLPVLWLYLIRLGSIFGAGYQANPRAFVDGLLLGSMVLLQQGSGLVLWVRSLIVKGR